MKKLLLTLATVLISFAGFAQDITEEPALGTEQNPYGEKSPWVLTVQRTQPQGTYTYYYIPKTESKKGNDDIYSLHVTLPNIEDSKQSCYYLTATYTDENGTSTKVVFTSGQSANNGSRYDLPLGGDDVELVVSAWGGNTATWNIKEYTLCDAKWTAFGYFPGITRNETSQTVTFYNPTEKSLTSRYFGGVAGGDATVGTLYVTGANPAGVFAVNQAEIANPGINTATINYTLGTIDIKRASSLDVAINSVETFVAPTEVSVPEGIKAYTFVGYENASDGAVAHFTSLSDGIIPAYTPVLLKADAPGTYSFIIPADAQFNHEEYLYYKDKDTKYLKDVAVTYDGCTFAGVNQAHNLPAKSFYLDNGQFVVNTDSKHVMAPFTCFINLDADVTSIAIDLGEEEVEEPIEDVLYVHFTDAQGNHIQTHYTVLTKQQDGTYASDVDMGNFTYFVLSDATFGETLATLGAFDGYPANRQWNELGDEAYVYHIGETAALDDDVTVPTTPSTTAFVKTKASELTGQFTPFALLTSGYTYQLSLNPDDETLTATNTGIATGIENVSVDKTDSNDSRIFDIFGRQVDASYKGIVIQNGKKYILR